MGIFAGYYSARFYRMFGVMYINLGKRLVKEFDLYIILISEFRLLAFFHDKLCFKNGKLERCDEILRHSSPSRILDMLFVTSSTPRRIYRYEKEENKKSRKSESITKHYS